MLLTTMYPLTKAFSKYGTANIARRPKTWTKKEAIEMRKSKLANYADIY